MTASVPVRDRQSDWHLVVIFPPTHLIHLVPLGVDSLVDDFALEELRPHLDDSVRVRLALNQPAQELVLSQQFLGLQEVDPQDPLMGERQREMVMMKGPDEDREHFLTFTVQSNNLRWNSIENAVFKRQVGRKKIQKKRRGLPHKSTDRWFFERPCVTQEPHQQIFYLKIRIKK